MTTRLIQPIRLTAANDNPGGATEAFIACAQLVSLLGRATARGYAEAQPANIPSAPTEKKAR